MSKGELSSENRLDTPCVAIVGGGIAGFSVAISLQAFGIKCFVYERDGGMILL